MKILATLSVLASIIICPVSEARSIRAYEDQVLRTVKIDGQATNHVATLHVDFIKSEMTVEILNDICGHFAPVVPGTIRCMAMPAPVRTIRAPLLKREQSCGSVVLSGMVDQTPVDGVRTEIRAVNNANRTCEDVIRSIYVVDATVFNPWTNTTTTYELLK